MKTYHIAFCGVFDLINYGDHLFPSIFKSKTTDLSLDLVLFSVTAADCTFSGPYTVHALKNLESMHVANPFDAIIVGGGALIHFHTIHQKLGLSNETFQEYPIFETWIIPSIVSRTYGIPLLWDCPGVPYDFEPALSADVKRLTDTVDYIAVRNEASRQSLLACGIASERVRVFPDSAFILPQVYPKPMLAEIARKLLGSQEPYVVFHCHKNIPEPMLLKSIETLCSLEAQHYKVVLLPLAYTHADEQCLQHVNQLCANHHFHIPNQTLNMVEMMALLANCHLYIGVSFHGAITAFTYGAKTIAIDFFGYRKTKAVYAQMERSQYYLTDADALQQTVDLCLADDTDQASCRAKLSLAVNEHFIGMRHLLTDLKSKPKGQGMLCDISNLYTTLDGLIGSINQSSRENSWLKEHSAILENYVNSLEEQLAWWKDHSAQLEARNSHHRPFH